MVINHKVTDAAFDFSESPFQALVGCLSLEAISLQVPTTVVYLACPETPIIVFALHSIMHRVVHK